MITHAVESLRDNNFRMLFIEILGWDHSRAEHVVSIDDREYRIEAVAHKRGLQVFVCTLGKLDLRNRYLLRSIGQQMAKRAHEHILIFAAIDADEQVWQWSIWDANKSKFRWREHPLVLTDATEQVLQLIRNLEIPLDQEENLTLEDVLRRSAAAFDRSPEVSLFFRNPRFTNRSDELARAMGTGRLEDLHRFVLFHYRLAAWAARPYLKTGIEEEDLMQIAFLGLMRAARRYNVDRGVAFSTYAVSWIKQSCQRYAPQHVLRAFIRNDVYWKYRRFRSRHDRTSLQHGAEAAAAYRRRYLDKHPRLHNVERELARVFGMPSLDDGEAALKRWCRTAEDPHCGPLKLAEIRDEVAQVIQAIDKLSDRDAVILRRRLGIDGPGATLEEIGDECGLTRERVRQIIEQNMDRVRKIIYVAKKGTR